MPQRELVYVCVWVIRYLAKMVAITKRARRAHMEALNLTDRERLAPGAPPLARVHLGQTRHEAHKEGACRMRHPV